jgi:hypothetical protein
MSVHQRLKKTALLALPPHTPRPFSPVKARVRKGAKRFQDPDFSQTALLDFLGFGISVHECLSAVWFDLD